MLESQDQYFSPSQYFVVLHDIYEKVKHSTTESVSSRQISLPFKKHWLSAGHLEPLSLYEKC
jgi:hypothetical protein